MKSINNFINFLVQRKIVTAVYFIFSTVLILQQYFLKDPANRFNNFKIFRNAVFHFFEHKDLYVPYPELHTDVFLYNPSFVILFLPFAFLPVFLGLLSWTMFKSWLYLYSIRQLNLSERQEALIFYLVLPELFITLAHFQTHVVNLCCIILCYVYTERRQFHKAYLLPVISLFVKVYGAVCGVFFILKNPKVKHFLYLTLGVVIIGLCPLLFYSPEQFVELYRKWLISMQMEHEFDSNSDWAGGLSIMGLIKRIFYGEVSVIGIQFIGLALFIVTLLLIIIKKEYEQIKWDLMTYIIMFIIMFNHSSESATYIIASTGVFLWFVRSEKSILNKSLFILFILLTVNSQSDIFPSYLRNTFVKPYGLKALPCAIVFFKIQFLLLFPHLRKIQYKGKKYQWV